jgi:hypothetical protein
MDYYSYQTADIINGSDIKIKITSFPSYNSEAHFRNETNWLNITKKQLASILAILIEGECKNV